MSYGVYIGGTGGKANKIKNIYIGNTEGKVEEVYTGYVGNSNGIAELFYKKAYVWNRYESKSEQVWSYQDVISLSNGMYSISNDLDQEGYPYFYLVDGYGENTRYYTTTYTKDIRHESPGDVYAVNSFTGFSVKLSNVAGNYTQCFVVTQATTSSLNMIGTVYSKQYLSHVEYSQGTYIDQVTSENPSAYPDNGRHSDGYWYVKVGS